MTNSLEMKIKNLLVTAAATLLLCSFAELPVSTGDFKVDGISYEVKKRRVGNEVVSTDTVTVCSGSLIPASGKLVIPEKIDFGGSIYTVGIIDFDAFKGRMDIKEAVLPPSITKIYSCAFDGCENLEKINIPEGVDMIDIWCFRKAKKLRDLTLPASVTKVDHGAFDRSGIRTLTLGEGLTSFSSYDAFMQSQTSLYLDLFTVKAPRCELKDIRAKLMVFKGKSFTLGKSRYRQDNDSRIGTILLENVDAPFELWEKGIVLPFASKCTVYVPDRLVNDFSSHPDWRHFKEIKPISKFKQ